MKRQWILKTSLCSQEGYTRYVFNLQASSYNKNVILAIYIGKLNITLNRFFANEKEIIKILALLASEVNI